MNNTACEVFILEDSAARTEHFATVYPTLYAATTPQEIITALTGVTPDVLFLDHDLGLYDGYGRWENTGYDVVRWLVENPGKTPPIIVVHTHNPMARGRMSHTLNRIATVRHVIAWPFTIPVINVC